MFYYRTCMKPTTETVAQSVMYYSKEFAILFIPSPCLIIPFSFSFPIFLFQVDSGALFIFSNTLNNSSSQAFPPSSCSTFFESLKSSNRELVSAFLPQCFCPWWKGHHLNLSHVRSSSHQIKALL